jgi:predicted transcriptional regulator
MLVIFNNKRSEADIVYELLMTAHKDIKKTRLMYQTNMTHSQISKYLDKLLEKQILDEKNKTTSGKVYSITDKGIELCKSLETVFDFFK